ncbi:pilus assembly protein N-terminal domain-containing protein [Hyalangium gracile]|uniref:pilus assembly protein N-terminal domain-containing protein n=1 Tax=Hyalangium gracile TaxID=394092 RepID=UPI001CC9E05B|nr:pilus assembly protein N-terminal domain-containing protein [Hyalangium gracile]
MKKLIRSTLLAVSLFSVPVFAEENAKPAPEAKVETVTVRAGNSKSLNVPGLTKLALGNVEFAEVSTPGGNLIRIEGLKAGETTLLVWTGSGKRKEYRIVVQP